MLRMGFSELSCEIEHQIREVVDEQQHNGWYFDIPGAQSLVSQLIAEQSELEGSNPRAFPQTTWELLARMSDELEKMAEILPAYLRHCEDSIPRSETTDDGTYSTMDWSEFNIGSPKQRVERLLELGWEPENFH
jgi:hypothetical protein